VPVARVAVGALLELAPDAELEELLAELEDAVDAAGVVLADELGAGVPEDELPEDELPDDELPDDELPDEEEPELPEPLEADGGWVYWLSPAEPPPPASAAAGAASASSPSRPSRIISWRLAMA
jgi:hypothetical protein